MSEAPERKSAADDPRKEGFAAEVALHALDMCGGEVGLVFVLVLDDSPPNPENRVGQIHVDGAIRAGSVHSASAGQMMIELAKRVSAFAREETHRLTAELGGIVARDAGGEGPLPPEPKPS